MNVNFRAFFLHLVGLCFLVIPVSADLKKDEVGLWIQDLSSETFKVREKASRELWKLGNAALPALRDAVLSNDPEVAMRAREAIDKVELRITENTPESILSLIESYRKAPTREKLGLMDQLKEEKAYFQMLKLYSMENAQDQNELTYAVDDVAMFAAREAIVAGDVDLAIELLRMAPPNHSELMALACLYRSNGQLDQQLTNLTPPQTLKPELWKGYLLRAKGDLDGAIENAEETNQLQILAGLKVLKGDPVPWLEQNHAPGHRAENPQRAQQAYIDIALKRWRGEEVGEKDFEPLMKLLNSNSRLQRSYGVGSLASLGKFSIAQKAQYKENPLMAYVYYLSREEIDKALEALGIDPKKPEFKKWVKMKFDIVKGGEQSDIVRMELAMMASFMEKRGLEKELEEAFDAHLREMQKDNPEKYWEIISGFFMGDAGAPNFTIKHVSKWAGEDEERWGEVFTAALGEEAEVMDWLVWIREIDPKMKDKEALEAMLAIFMMNSSPGKLREKWIDRIWKVIMNEKDVDLKMQRAMQIMQLCISQKDAKNTLRAWDLLDEKRKETARWGSIDIYLTAAGRWKEAAEILIHLTGDQKHASPEIHAHLAATMRRGGMEEEAKVRDELVDKLALGSVASSMEIGDRYAYGGDFERADVWFRRAALEADPTNAEFLSALEKCAQRNIRSRNWQLAASCHEVILHINSSQQYSDNSIDKFAKTRMNADLARAISILPENKERALKTLKTIHQDFMPDGVLADDFFPALREVGLDKELQTWFMESWNLMVGVIEKYPKSHNSRNTAAWFASRAGMKLAEAEKYLIEAINMSPEQAAYLDTMGELKFAQGDRKAALEWSQRSVCFEPFEDMIRSQHERFRTAPLPKN